jgi:hypothetical protein
MEFIADSPVRDGVQNPNAGRPELQGFPKRSIKLNVLQHTACRFFLEGSKRMNQIDRVTLVAYQAMLAAATGIRHRNRRD